MASLVLHWKIKLPKSKPKAVKRRRSNSDPENPTNTRTTKRKSSVLQFISNIKLPYQTTSMEVPQNQNQQNNVVAAKPVEPEVKITNPPQIVQPIHTTISHNVYPIQTQVLQERPVSLNVFNESPTGSKF